MKRLILFFLFSLFFLSCEKESFDVVFLDVGYCRIPNGVELKFIVDETLSVKKYVIESAKDMSRNYTELASIESRKTQGQQLYSYKLGMNRPFIYRIKAVHTNKKIQFSKEFLLN
jgi:hypothetical protein